MDFSGNFGASRESSFNATVLRASPAHLSRAGSCGAAARVSPLKDTTFASPESSRVIQAFHSTAGLKPLCRCPQQPGTESGSGDRERIRLSSRALRRRLSGTPGLRSPRAVPSQSSAGLARFTRCPLPPLSRLPSNPLTPPGRSPPNSTEHL